MERTSRRFSAEITFAGLCLIQFKDCEMPRKGEAGPRTAGQVEVLLIRTPNDSSSHDHVPFLNYFLEDDLTTPEGTRLIAGPDGRQIVSLDIAGHDIEITPPYGYEGKFERSELSWINPALRGSSLDVPEDPGEDGYLDWVLGTHEFGLEGIKSELNVAKISVPNGKWSCTGVARNREVPSLRPLKWHLVDQEGEPVGVSRALGTDVKLRLDDLPYGPVIALTNRETSETDQIQLTPGTDDVVRLSFSNLPQYVGPSEEGHLPMYQDIAPGSTPYSLRQADQLSCNPWRPCYAALQFERS